jgi:hypothetical protein
MNIPELEFKVDRERWGDLFDPADKNQLIAENINGYIAHMTKIYQLGKYKDDGLWQIFHEDFEGFIMEIFLKAYHIAAQDLWACLYGHGVWVKKVKGTLYARVLKACLEEEEPHKWTKLEIEERTKAQIWNQNTLQ